MAACHAIAGVVVMVAILAALDMIYGDRPSDVGSTIVCAGIGAAVGGYVFAGLYGFCDGPKDWIKALIGAILATALGSFLGGAIWPFTALFHGDLIQSASIPGVATLLALPFRAGLFGLMVVMGLAPFEQPLLVPFWFGVMGLVQVAAILARRSSVRPDRLLSVF